MPEQDTVQRAAAFNRSLKRRAQAAKVIAPAAKSHLSPSSASGLKPTQVLQSPPFESLPCLSHIFAKNYYIQLEAHLYVKIWQSGLRNLEPLTVSFLCI